MYDLIEAWWDMYTTYFLKLPTLEKESILTSF